MIGTVRKILLSGCLILATTMASTSLAKAAATEANEANNVNRSKAEILTTAIQKNAVAEATIASSVNSEHAAPPAVEDSANNSQPQPIGATEKPAAAIENSHATPQVTPVKTTASSVPTLEIHFPNGGRALCPLREIRTSVLLLFSSRDLNTDPGKECLRIVNELERQQNIQDLRSLLVTMQGKTQDEYKRALGDYLLGKLGVSRAKISQIRVQIDARDFLEWSDQEIATYLKQRYEKDTQVLKRIREARLRTPGAFVGVGFQRTRLSN